MKDFNKKVALALGFLSFLTIQNANASWFGSKKTPEENMSIKDPFFNDREEFFRLHNNMEQAFDSFWKSFKQMPMPVMPANIMMVDNFKTDVTENKDNIVVTAELPGMDKNAIDISLSEDFLTIKGEKKTKTETSKDNQYHMQEISYGSFNRTIVFPSKVDVTKYKANFENGVLKVEITKLPPKEEPKNITKIKLD
ncbi:MAG: Spore protein SP21 [Alphaproteobacteria bacterium ADurb.Bin438]|nr:MAG: Spore protein SP21 [Alphaproteobacteria bacterium ADurb.Bin438]